MRVITCKKLKKLGTKTKWLLPLVAVLLAQGCAVWKPVTMSQATIPKGPTVQLPQGWMRFMPTGNNILITKDGLALQLIEVHYRKAEDSFAKDKRPEHIPNAPEQLAELELAQLRSIPALRTLEVLENRPTTIAGLPAYRLHLRFRNAKGLRYDRLVYGAINKDQYLRATYSAAYLFYFDRDLSEFESVVKSLRFEGK
jgi:hypothetical protein